MNVPENWKEGPKMPYRTGKPEYKQLIEGLDPNERYQTKHQILDKLTGTIIDEIVDSPELPKLLPFGQTGENTVTAEKDGSTIIAKWSIDNVPKDDKPKSLIVSKHKYITVTVGFALR